ncbi:hypothetical protein [Streptomyces sp. x-19]|uniref:hypothetical protein n=1 Tax=Streptomyces sp. x-19 TaxID=2789280 RepID=UPI00397FF9E3
MGGLVTRYALARLETERIGHQTGVCFSWDGPRTGAWIPLSLQAFAHYVRKLDDRFSCQINSPAVSGTELRTQSEGDDRLVAKLRVVTVPTREVRTSGLPDIDGAPGGALEGFGILADALNKLAPVLGFAVENPIREHCFVPVVSAVAVREPSRHADRYLPIDELAPEESALDDFVLASRDEEHTLIAEELSGWLLDRLP